MNQKTQSYPEPETLVPSETETHGVGFSLGAEQIRLDVQHYFGLGVSLELRFDELSKELRRQPFTGQQEALEQEILKPESSDGRLSYTTVDGWALSLSEKTGAISISKGSELLLESTGGCLFAHAEEQELYESTSSRKFTDFGQFFDDLGMHHTYTSHMRRFQYDKPEGSVLGLPGQTGEMDRSGYRFSLFNTDTPHHTPDRPAMYQSWPIVMHRSKSGNGWVAVFFDNPARSFADIGDFYKDKLTFEAVRGNIRVNVFFDSDLQGLSHKLSRFLGACTLPPLWAYGYQQCRWSYMSTNEIREVAAAFDEREIPLDCLYFDIDYMDGYRVFTVDQENFSDLPQCTSELHEKGIHTVGIVDPGVKVDPEFDVYQQVLKSGEFYKKEDGDPFVIRCWPEDALLPDFISESFRDQWSGIQSQWQSANGIDGVWNDMNEPANFDGGNRSSVKAFTDRGSIQDEFNLYGFSMAMASKQGCQKTKPENRPFVISRSGYPGVQQHAVIWHGDNHAWWEHLRLALETTVQYALCGAFYTGPDVPGFFGNPPVDLAVRFYQLGAFLPMYRGHSCKVNDDKEPYTFGEEGNGLIKDAILLRYSLLREFYSGFEQCYREQRSPYLPVFDRDGDLVRDQFLLFDKLLIAPITQRGQKQRATYLPEGEWYRLGNTKDRLSGSKWLLEEVSLSSIPVYVRAGSILTRSTPKQRASQTLAAEERFETYPTSAGAAAGYWFSDDGQSLQSESERKSLVLEAGAVVQRPL